MQTTHGRQAAFTMEGKGRTRTLARVLATAAVAAGLLAMSAGSASAATAPCTGAGAVQLIGYESIGTGGIKSYPRLAGNVSELDHITATFTVPSTCTNGVEVSFVSYITPSPGPHPSTANEDIVYQQQTATFFPGQENTIETDIPPCYFEVDLVQGPVIAEFNPAIGLTYSAQKRLVDQGRGGVTPCLGPTQEPDVTPAASLTLSPKTATNRVGTQHTVTATASDASGDPVAGVTVRFATSGANTATGSKVTYSSGNAMFTYTGPNEGIDTINAFADNNNNGAQDPGEPFDRATKVWFTPLSPGSGAFVIGDQNATVGAEVTFSAIDFWGSQWSKLNLLSGGEAPAAFKGFASTAANPPTCGQSWSTDNSWTSRSGNSSGPPATIPGFMAVIGASKITKSGSLMYGNSPKVVIVKTNAGYAPNPGHWGTGTVVAVLCGV